MSEDAKTLIEQAVRSFLEEVPALKPMKLVVGVDLHGRGDTQQFRVELPEVDVTQGHRGGRARPARHAPRLLQPDGRARREGGRLARGVRDGRAKATGVDQYLKLIVNVIERQEERNRTRRARH